MRIAALYDIHGNLPALEAVLDEVHAAGVDRVVVGGDVFPGPLALECLRRLQGLELPTAFLHGNGDRVVLAQRNGEPIDEVPVPHRPPIRWHADQLDDATAQLLAAWPATVREHIPGLGDVLFCHGTPTSDREIVTRLTPEPGFTAAFEGAAADLVVCGHTHMQFDRTVGDLRVVNAGSIGMPFAHPGAYWLLLGPDIELRSTRYDLAAAAGRVRHTDYPGADDFAARSILEPPSEGEMLTLMSP